MKFNELNLSENLKKAIDEIGYVECTSVQEETFQLTVEDRDVLAQSQTGTGKTAAFLIPIFQLFLENAKYKNGKALIVVPTRELAVQVEKEASRLSAYLDFSILAVYGGVGYQKQEEALAKGVDVIVATPGRLIDFKKSGKVDLSEINIVVIDEADRLFDMGFLPDLTTILKGMRPPAERRTMLFSATLGTKVGNLAWEFMDNPGEVIIEPENVTIDLVKQELYHVGRDEKMSLLLGLFKKHNPKSAVIFTNTKGMAYEVSQRLNVNGYQAEYLIGDLPQNKRTAIMDRVKKGEIPFLVATDVAARGLHINDLEMVFNYDIPDEAESYVHRIGRTGRAGKEGHAISLACENFVLGLTAIESYIDMKIPVVWAEEDAFAEDASAGQRFRLDSGRDGRGGRDSRGGRDNRGGRDTRGKDNRGARDNRGGRGGRDGNRDRDNRGRPNRSQPSGPQRRDDSHAASVVDMAVGSLESFGKSAKPVASPKSESRNNNNNRNRNDNRNDNRKNNNNRGRKPSDQRKKSFEGESSISGDLSVQDRLAYYKKKYGDDFKPTEDMLKSDKSRAPRQNKDKKKGPQQRPAPKGQNSKSKNSQRKPHPGQNKGQNKGQGKVAQAPQKEAPKSPKKVSLIKKIFGKK